MSYDFNQDMRQWADIEGGFHPDRQWLLSSVDTWHKNPHYKGDAEPHPSREDDEARRFAEEEASLIELRDNMKRMIDSSNADLKWHVDQMFKRIGIKSP